VSRKFVPLAFLGLLAVAGISDAQTPPATPPTYEPPVIVTSGEAVSKVAPDRASVTVTSESRARNPREAQKLNAAAMSAVLQQLKGAGIPQDAIRTTSVDLQPEFDYADGRQTLRGYVARNSVEVRVDTLSRLGEILDLAVGAGASTIAGVRFELQDREAAERAVLKRAVMDARRRAEAAAEGAGVRIERIVRIEEQRAREIPPQPMMTFMRGEMAQQAQTPIAPGTIEVRATVTLTAAVR
jgi:uncharacterized protein YggE